MKKRYLALILALLLMMSLLAGCGSGKTGSGSGSTAASSGAQQPAAPAPGRPGSCTVRLTPEGNPAGTVYVTMEPGSSRTLGRNSKADVILNPRDTALSGLHFELQWDGHILYLTDCGSTNGTSLTGIPQRPGHWSKVEPGTTLQAGSVRYKVKITKN